MEEEEEEEDACVGMRKYPLSSIFIKEYAPEAVTGNMFDCVTAAAAAAD